MGKNPIIEGMGPLLMNSHLCIHCPASVPTYGIVSQAVFCIIGTVKLGFKERLNKEQIGNSEPVYLIDSEQIGNFVMTKTFLMAKFDCTIEIEDRVQDPAVLR